ncbi:MAG: DUF5674 family protein [Patescibacteria group bacterium]
MPEIQIINEPIAILELKRIAEERFGDLVKAAVDIRQGIMAVGGEFHSDEQTFLIEKYGSKSEDTWGINLYPDKLRNEMIEFDSVINLRPLQDNRSRGIEDQKIRNEIEKIVAKLIFD